MFCNIENRIYNLNPLFFLGSSVFRNPSCNFFHCSLNHSPIGCLFMVSISLINMLKVYNRIHLTLYKVMNHSNNIQMPVKLFNLVIYRELERLVRE